MRIEDEDIDLAGPAKSFDGGGAGIARGRADDGRALAAPGKDMLHQPAKELHGQILEGEGRPVEQLEQEEDCRRAARAARRRHGRKVP